MCFLGAALACTTLLNDIRKFFYSHRLLKFLTWSPILRNDQCLRLIYPRCILTPVATGLVLKILSRIQFGQWYHHFCQPMRGASTPILLLTFNFVQVIIDALNAFLPADYKITLCTFILSPLKDIKAKIPPKRFCCAILALFSPTLQASSQLQALN